MFENKKPTRRCMNPLNMRKDTSDKRYSYKLTEDGIVRRGVDESEWPFSDTPHPDGDQSILACPNCGSGEYLHNEDGNRNKFCGQCGTAINWEPATEQGSAE